MSENLTPEQEKQFNASLNKAEQWTIMCDKLRDAMNLTPFEYTLGCVMNAYAVEEALPKEYAACKSLIKVGVKKMEEEKNAAR